MAEDTAPEAAENQAAGQQDAASPAAGGTALVCVRTVSWCSGGGQGPAGALRTHRLVVTSRWRRVITTLLALWIPPSPVQRI